MNTTMIHIIIFIILALTIILTITYWISFLHIEKLAKRFEPFALLPRSNDQISFFDKAIIILKRWLLKCSNICRKSKILVDYAKKYERFIAYDEKDKKETIDYVSLKFNMAILFLFLSLVVITIKHTKLNL